MTNSPTSSGVAKIVAFANQKGGVGKSTACVNVAEGIREKGYRVVVIDADPQNTIVQWSAAGGEGGGLPFTVSNLAAAGKMIHREIRKYTNDFDFILVDCPPSVADARPAVVLMVADLVVMPTSSSPTDFWSSVEFLQLVNQARVTNESLRAVWLLNKTEKKRMLSKSIEKAVAATEVPVLEAQLANRECYKQAAALGTTVLQMNDRGAKAAAVEVRAVASEIVSLVTA